MCPPTDHSIQNSTLHTSDVTPQSYQATTHLPQNWKKIKQLNTHKPPFPRVAKQKQPAPPPQNKEITSTSTVQQIFVLILNQPPNTKSYVLLETSQDKILARKAGHVDKNNCLVLAVSSCAGGESSVHPCGLDLSLSSLHILVVVVYVVEGGLDWDGLGEVWDSGDGTYGGTGVDDLLDVLVINAL